MADTADQYALLTCEDVPTTRSELRSDPQRIFDPTKRKYISRHPDPIREIKENIEMYNRHNDGTKIFGYEIVGTYREVKENSRFKDCIFIHSCYQPNPFNAALKKERYSYTIIPAHHDDRRDCAWKIISDSVVEEKRWVDDIFNSIADDLYRQCVKDGTEEYKIFGSLCHQGFVNHLFDYHHESGMSSVRRWITQIGTFYDPIKIQALKSYDSDSIYEGGFFSSHVRKLCWYCEMMFGVSRYEVAKNFAKKSPEYFLSKEGDVTSKAHNIAHVAAIYAENGNYEKALEYYKLSVSILDGKDWQCNYQQSLDNFLKYYQQNGTSILSSVF
ncbi:Hypothetical protein HVR_LOCUS850 [uncultured virus]|nr:Hypothetical protein HVR_LOCUS850 [uncultured virus]